MHEAIFDEYFSVELILEYQLFAHLLHISQ